MSDGQPDEPGRRRKRRPRHEPTPTQRALVLLTRREHSRTELTRKLLVRGVEPDTAQATVAKLGDAGWQDDARFAESLLRSRSGAGYGPVRIQAELRMHQVATEVVEAAMSGFEGDWAANARDLVARRFGAGIEDDPVARRRAAELLYRRGFNGDQVRAATRFDPDD